METRKKVSEYSTSELIRMARQAISADATKDEFKKVFLVDFDFNQLCLSLYRRRYDGKRIISSVEYKEMKSLSRDQLAETFFSIMTRYEDALMKVHENREK